MAEAGRCIDARILESTELLVRAGQIYWGSRASNLGIVDFGGGVAIGTRALNDCELLVFRTALEAV